jgi:hypothetical protein
MTTDGSEVRFALVDTQQTIDLVWPQGFSARAASELAELVAPDGQVIAREGDVLNSLRGTSQADGSEIVCFTSPADYPHPSSGRRDGGTPISIRIAPVLA